MPGTDSPIGDSEPTGYGHWHYCNDDANVSDSTDLGTGSSRRIMPATPLSESPGFASESLSELMSRWPQPGPGASHGCRRFGLTEIPPSPARPGSGLKGSQDAEPGPVRPGGGKKIKLAY